MERLQTLALAMAGSAFQLSLGCTSGDCAAEACDVRDASCQEEIMRSTACLRGRSPERITVTVRRREQYMAEAQAQVPDDAAAAAAAARFAATQAAYALFDLENGTVSSRQITQGFVGTVGAFYNSNIDEIVILHDGEALDSLEYGALLAHEFSHALQARHSLLNEVGVETTDQFLTARAMIEGDAARTEDQFYALGAGRKPSDLKWDPIFERWITQSEFFYRSQSSHVRLASRFFTYSFGARYLQDAFERGGQAAVQDALTDRPQSSIDVVLRHKVDRIVDRQEFAASAVPQLQGAQLLSVDSLGWWVLSRGSVLGDAIRARRVNVDQFSWRGDSLSLWARTGDSEPLAALRVRFSTDSDAQLLSELLRGGTVESRLSILVEGSDLILLATADPQWLAQLRANRPNWGPGPSAQEFTTQDGPDAGLSDAEVSDAGVFGGRPMIPGASLGAERLWCPRSLALR